MKTLKFLLVFALSLVYTCKDESPQLDKAIAQVSEGNSNSEEDSNSFKQIVHTFSEV